VSAAVERNADWFSAMRRGDFSTAWEISDQILAERVASGPRWDLPRHEQWVWDGRDLAGRTVLVRCYHGLGDTLQFARFLPTLTRLARRTIVWAQAPLIPLLRTLPCTSEFLPLHDGTPEVDYDAEIEIMELAHALRVSVGELARGVPYFDVPYGRRLSERFSVGVVAEAGDWDARRSVPGELFSSLVTETSADFFSMQLGTPLPHMLDASAADVLELASRAKALDLVISADTMMAHLAGALGVRTWTLLPADADWRWMSDRSDSPWYPTMRLFRMVPGGTWQAVLHEVRTCLACAL
jgi:hypothetical protein